MNDTKIVKVVIYGTSASCRRVKNGPVFYPSNETFIILWIPKEILV